MASGEHHQQKQPDIYIDINKWKPHPTTNSDLAILTPKLVEDIEMNCHVLNTFTPSCAIPTYSDTDSLNSCRNRYRQPIMKFVCGDTGISLVTKRYVNNTDDLQIVVVQQEHDSNMPFNKGRPAIVVPSSKNSDNKASNDKYDKTRGSETRLKWYIWDPLRLETAYGPGSECVYQLLPSIRTSRAQGVDTRTRRKNKKKTSINADTKVLPWLIHTLPAESTVDDEEEEAEEDEEGERHLFDERYAVYDSDNSIDTTSTDVSTKPIQEPTLPAVFVFDTQHSSIIHPTSKGSYNENRIPINEITTTADLFIHAVHAGIAFTTTCVLTATFPDGESFHVAKHIHDWFDALMCTATQYVEDSFNVVTAAADAAAAYAAADDNDNDNDNDNDEGEGLEAGWEIIDLFEIVIALPTTVTATANDNGNGSGNGNGNFGDARDGNKKGKVYVYEYDFEDGGFESIRENAIDISV